MTFLNIISTAFIIMKYYRTLNNCVGWNKAVGMNLYGLDGSGFGQRWGVRFHGPVQTSPETRPATCTLTNRVPFPEVKRPGRDADHLPPYRTEVKETVQLHISVDVSSWHVI